MSRCRPEKLTVSPARGAGTGERYDNDEDADRDRLTMGDEPSTVPNADERSLTPVDDDDAYASAHKHDSENTDPI